MNTTTPTQDADLRTLVRSLDPAASDPLKPDAATRVLDRVVATPRHAPEVDPALAPARRRRRTRRWVIAGALASAPLAAAVLVPGLGGANAAYAGWSAVPAQLEDESAQIAQCRDALHASVAGDPPALDGQVPAGTRWATPSDVSEAKPVIAERRGDQALILLASEAGFEGVCFTPTAVDATSGRLPAGGMASTSFRANVPIKPFQIAPMGWIEGGDGSAVVVTGRVGSDVREVWARDGLGLSVKATVSNGHYAAWWPDSAQPLVHRDPTLTVVLSDGTVESGISARGHDGLVGLPNDRPAA